jgi:hypothetical protein
MIAPQRHVSLPGTGTLHLEVRVLHHEGPNVIAEPVRREMTLSCQSCGPLAPITRRLLEVKHAVTDFNGGLRLDALLQRVRQAFIELLPISFSLCEQRLGFQLTCWRTRMASCGGISP